MATNTYKCTVCKREAERVENVYGLNTFSKCSITSGCRGKMYRVGRNPDNIRESFPKLRSDLEDYTARAAFTKHQQDIASKTWVITHGLNCEPAIAVVVGGITLPNTAYTVTTIDRNKTRLTFATATSGIVMLAARTSAIAPVKVAQEAEKTRVTRNGTFVFAVPKLLTKADFVGAPPLPLDLKNPVGDIRLEVILERPNQEPIWCYEKLDGMHDLTAWSGTDEVLVSKRRQYYLKTKNILNFATFNNPDLTFADIPEGTRLRFTMVDYGTGVAQPIESRGLLMFLTKPVSGDRIRNELLDIGELTSVDGYLNYSDGEFYVDTDVIERTFPPIEAVRTIGAAPPLPSPTPTPTITPTISITPTITVSVTTSRTPTPTPSATTAVTSTPTPTPTVTATSVVSPTPTVTSSLSATPTPTATVTPTPTHTVTPTPTSSVPAFVASTVAEDVMGLENFTGSDATTVRVVRYDPLVSANNGKIFEQDLGIGSNMGWFVDGNYLYVMAQDGFPHTSLYRLLWNSGTSQYEVAQTYGYDGYYGNANGPAPDNQIVTKHGNYLFWSISPGSGDGYVPIMKMIDATTGTDYGDLNILISGYSESYSCGAVYKIGSYYCFALTSGYSGNTQIVVFHLSGTTMVQDYIYDVLSNDASGNPFYLKKGMIGSDGTLLYLFGAYTSGYYDNYGLKVLEFNGATFSERNRLYTFDSTSQPGGSDTFSGYVEGTTFHLYNSSRMTLVKFDPTTNTFSETQALHSTTGVVGTANRLHASPVTKRLYGDNNRYVYSYAPSGVATVYAQRFLTGLFNNNHYTPLPAINPFTSIAPTPTVSVTPTKTPTPTPSPTISVTPTSTPVVSATVTPTPTPTVSTSASLTDPFFSSVNANLHFNDSNGATTTTDTSPLARTFTFNGPAAISTAQSKYGTGSLAILSGSNTYITAPNVSAANDFGSGNLTVELWVYKTSFSANEHLCSYTDNSGNDEFRMVSGAGGTISWLWYHSGAYQVSFGSASGAITASTQTHIAFVRNGNVHTIYVNGVSVATATTSHTQPTNSSRNLYIGDLGTINSFYTMRGYIDDFRVTKGVARYTANFTPPTAQNPDS